MHIGIYRDQFTVCDALALYMLQKHDNDWEVQEIVGDDVSQLDMHIRDGNICINTNRQGREQMLTQAKCKLTAAVEHLKTDILQCRPAAKLTPAGVAYALCCVKDLEDEIRGIFQKCTEKALRMDISYIYEATVEIVDTEYWHTALPSLNLELKYPTSQKEDFLVRVREISELSHRISALESEVIENSVENGLENSVKNDGTLLSIVECTVNLIALDYENVVDWFFSEWVATNGNVWHGLNNRYKIHHTDVIIFLLPAEWNVNGLVLSSEIQVPGIISIAHPRDHAITETFESAYNLAIKALEKSSEATDWTPTKENKIIMKLISNLTKDRLLGINQPPENP